MYECMIKDENPTLGFYEQAFNISDEKVEQFLKLLEDKGRFVYDKSLPKYKDALEKRKFFISCEHQLRFGSTGFAEVGNTAKKLYEFIRSDLRGAIRGRVHGVQFYYPFLEQASFLRDFMPLVLSVPDVESNKRAVSATIDQQKQAQKTETDQTEAGFSGVASGKRVPPVPYAIPSPSDNRVEGILDKGYYFNKLGVTDDVVRLFLRELQFHPYIFDRTFGDYKKKGVKEIFFADMERTLNFGSGNGATARELYGRIRSDSRASARHVQTAPIDLYTGRPQILFPFHEESAFLRESNSGNRNQGVQKEEDSTSTAAPLSELEVKKEIKTEDLSDSEPSQKREKTEGVEMSEICGATDEASCACPICRRLVPRDLLTNHLLEVHCQTITVPKKIPYRPRTLCSFADCSAAFGSHWLWALHCLDAHPEQLHGSKRVIDRSGLSEQEVKDLFHDVYKTTGTKFTTNGVLGKRNTFWRCQHSAPPKATKKFRRRCQSAVLDCTAIAVVMKRVQGYEVRMTTFHSGHDVEVPKQLSSSPPCNSQQETQHECGPSEPLKDEPVDWMDSEPINVEQQEQTGQKQGPSKSCSSGRVTDTAPEPEPQDELEKQNKRFDNITRMWSEIQIQAISMLRSGSRGAELREIEDTLRALKARLDGWSQKAPPLGPKSAANSDSPQKLDAAVNISKTKGARQYPPPPELPVQHYTEMPESVAGPSVVRNVKTVSKPPTATATAVAVPTPRSSWKIKSTPSQSVRYYPNNRFTTVLGNFRNPVSSARHRLQPIKVIRYCNDKKITRMHFVNVPYPSMQRQRQQSGPTTSMAGLVAKHVQREILRGARSNNPAVV